MEIRQLLRQRRLIDPCRRQQQQQQLRDIARSVLARDAAASGDPRGAGMRRAFFFGGRGAPLGVAAKREIFLSRSICSATRALLEPSRSSAVQQPDEESEERSKKQQEASPQDCDAAVEGLTSAKAKAQLVKEPPRKSLMHKTWSILLGIGPALRAIASMSRADWALKMKGWKKSLKETLQHYWVGTKRLWIDIRISSRLLGKLAKGKSLSRREPKQLTRTAADIFRLVPFAVFVIVPFMEFLLPVFLKLLPSTFQDKMEEKLTARGGQDGQGIKIPYPHAHQTHYRQVRRGGRMEYARFLQETVVEMAKEVKTNTSSSEVQRTAEDLEEFLTKVRTGKKVENEDILAFAKFFNDELTLDNVSRSRLVSMCKYMGIKPYGTNAYLHYSLRQTLARIKADDRMIQSEGIDALSEQEVVSACRERGILEVTSVDELKEQLRNWLDLNHALPSSLLTLSRSFLSGSSRIKDALQATLLSLPDEVVESVGVTVLPSEDALEERKRKLEYLQSQEEFIKEEAEDEQEEQERLRKQEEAEHGAALAVLASASRVTKEIGILVESPKAYQADKKDADQVNNGTKIFKALISKVDTIVHKREMWKKVSIRGGDARLRFVNLVNPMAVNKRHYSLCYVWDCGGQCFNPCCPFGLTGFDKCYNDKLKFRLFLEYACWEYMRQYNTPLPSGLKKVLEFVLTIPEVHNRMSSEALKYGKRVEQILDSIIKDNDFWKAFNRINTIHHVRPEGSCILHVDNPFDYDQCAALTCLLRPVQIDCIIMRDGVHLI